MLKFRRTAVCLTAFAITTGTGFVAHAAPVPAPSVPTTVAAGTARATTVRLLTGDSVRVTPRHGVPQLTLVPRHGSSGAMVVRRLGSHAYAIPTAATRYLGSVLDPGLFDVSSRGSVPRVSVTGGSTDVPGLTVTSRSGTSREGYFTAAGARTFGAALERQFRDDLRAHRAPARLFGAARIAPAAAAPPVATPKFPQQTLTITVTDLAGKPVDEADLALVNVDDSTKFSNVVPVVDGVAKVSVPIGRYAGLVGYFRETADGEFATYLVPKEGIEVTSSGGRATFDVRTATTVPAVHTPRPAAATGLSLEWDRGSSADAGVGIGYGLDPDAPVYVAPTAKVTRGRLDWVTSWSLAGSPAGQTPYTYDLSYHDVDVVPADQTRTVRAGAVARIDARYYADSPRRASAAFGRGAAYPFQLLISTSLPEFGFPATRTEYVQAPADAVWYATLIAAPTYDDPFQGFVADEPRAYAPGSTQRADWLRGPLGPNFVSPTPQDRYFTCGYCRDGSSLVLGLATVGDTDPGHDGTFDLPDEDTVAAHFRLYRDGAVIADQDNATGGQVDVTAGRSTYRAVVSTSRGLAGFASSTRATTDVTFVSSASSGNAAPASWTCPGDGRCTVLPVLTARLPVPSDLAGVVGKGTKPTRLTVGHARGAADPAITSVSVALSYDGGRTYTAVPVTSVDNHTYDVALANPASAAGKPVAIRISATDAAGGKLVQTAVAAYTVAR